MRLSVPAILFCCFFAGEFCKADADTFGTGPNEFEIEFVTVGNPGNLPDLTGNPRPVGAVDYVYEIGKYEISRVMIEMASADGGLGFTLDPMVEINTPVRPNMPATGVSWNEAARLVNWMNESHGFPHAYKFAVQPGDEGYKPNDDILLWDVDDFGYDPDNRFRNTQTHYVLPTAHEWYKSAFYDPNGYGGAGRWFNHAYGSDDPPESVRSGTDPNTAVHSLPSWVGPADIKEAGGLSPYGVMALTGNVWEWEETEIDMVNDDPMAVRGVRGGRWVNFPTSFSVFYRDDDDEPINKLFNLGVRVGSVEVPTSEIEFDVSPGVGKFATSDDDYMIVERIDEGLRVRTSQTSGDDATLPEFSVNWNGDANQWYQFKTSTGTVSADPQDSLHDVLISQSGVQFRDQILFAGDDPKVYDFLWQPTSLGEGIDERYLEWEFTVVPIDAPIPGDTNADGEVGFADFLALSGNYGRDGRGWSGGDFDFNGTTDFVDFLTFSGNYGSIVRNASVAAAAVPEPSGLTLVAIGYFSLCGLRRRR